jgi:hypothetical protein
VSTSSGPARPSGTCAQPTWFSILPRAEASGTGAPETCTGSAPAARDQSARRAATGAIEWSSVGSRGIGGSEGARRRLIGGACYAAASRRSPALSSR